MKYATFATAVAGLITALLYLAGYHVVHKPTEDQLYGCTVAQQAPNGECK